MNDWAERAKAHFSNGRGGAPAKTDPTGIASVSSVPDPGLCELLAAAMQACDHHGDGDDAREQMRRDCQATPLHLQADLLAHFHQNYGPLQS
jgi:hypothetical protein